MAQFVWRTEVAAQTEESHVAAAPFVVGGFQGLLRHLAFALALAVLALARTAADAVTVVQRLKDLSLRQIGFVQTRSRHSPCVHWTLDFAESAAAGLDAVLWLAASAVDLDCHSQHWHRDFRLGLPGGPPHLGHVAEPGF